MNDIAIKYNGTTVFWSLVDGTSISELREGFETLGRGDLLPETQNDSQALRRALSKNFPSKSKIVRPLSGVTGFAIVDEQETINSAGVRKLVHQEELRIALSGTTMISNPPDHVRLDAIKADYLYEKQRVTATKLGGILIKACNQLSGIPLRPRGGMYWIPNSKTAEWEQIVSVVETANPKNTVYKMKTTTDGETVDAVCDSLITEVEKQLDTLSESLLSEDLGKRALNTKRNTATDLKDLVTEYEGILGKTLTKLQDRADEVHSAASMALIQSMM